MTMPSEITELKEKINQLKHEKEAIWYSALRHCTETINRANYLSEDVKSKLLEEIWRK